MTTGSRTPSGSAPAGATMPESAPRAHGTVDAEAVAQVLNRLDWQLGEAGRRGHLFSWLRDPESGEWLTVAAYYPGNRVVVVAFDDVRLHATAAEWVPANGLYLLSLSAPDLTADPMGTAKALRSELTNQGWPARSHPSPSAARRPAAPALPARRDVPDEVDEDSWDDLPEAAPPQQAHLRPVEARAVRPHQRARPTQADGIWLGLALVAVILIELVVGGAILGLDNGQYVLCLGFLLDAAARALGAVAASGSDDLDGAWTSVIIGSPALWGLQRPEAEGTADGADVSALARVTAIIAGVMLALGILIAIL